MQQKRLYIPLTVAEFARLRELAWAQRRSPRDHAAVLLVRALGMKQSGGPATDSAVPPSAPLPCSSAASHLLSSPVTAEGAAS
jgi:hypothetical protein